MASGEYKGEERLRKRKDRGRRKKEKEEGMDGSKKRGRRKPLIAPLIAIVFPFHLLTLHRRGRTCIEGYLIVNSHSGAACSQYMLSLKLLQVFTPSIIRLQKNRG